ncbi:MAG: FG-GAP repeat protein [Planctomycetota bacterium JB042]
MPRSPLSVALVLPGLLSIVPAAHGQCVFEELEKVVPSDGAAGDTYGGPLAVDGDVLVVGAPLADGVHPNSGAAYVHRRIGGAWVEEAKLQSDDPQPYDDFGISVDVEGDVLVVGAFFDDEVLPDAGAAFVYVHDGHAWVPTQKLTASTPGFQARFGRAVALEGDWLAISAYRSDDLGADSGSVHLFRRVAGTWVERQKLVASDGAAGDLFGVDLAFCGDALLVGAYFDDTTHPDTGSAYVFRFDGNTWSEEAKLVPADAAAGDVLGASVALDGDTAVVGSYGDDAAGFDSGAVYVFERVGGAWIERQELVAADTGQGDEFGWAVDVRGDVLAVGAYEDDDLGHDSGAAYVFRRVGGVWVEERKIRPSDGASLDWFGSSVGILGDDLWVGSMRDDQAAVDVGAAYRFDLRPLALRADPTGASAGETLTLETAPGPAGQLAALVLVELAGNPKFLPLAILPFGADCRMTVGAPVPAGLVGLSASFRSYGFTVTGVVEETDVVAVDFL